MHRSWRIDKRGITMTVTMVDAASVDSPARSMEEQKRRVLTFLTQNMAAAIAAAVVADMDDNRGTKGGNVENN